MRSGFSTVGLPFRASGCRTLCFRVQGIRTRKPLNCLSQSVLSPAENEERLWLSLSGPGECNQILQHRKAAGNHGDRNRKQAPNKATPANTTNQQRILKLNFQDKAV